ncbi:MAG: hypothetical protein IIU02_10615 [Treponema sp.]|uniref:hypothetical protein n=1 Tax=Treponema sp. TaxID=166 RepID=UPI00257E1518|nr:hypothetical protein [Treponema sp.]MBQ5538340.1 hypothetical protein [Treponema sp.]
MKIVITNAVHRLVKGIEQNRFDMACVIVFKPFREWKVCKVSGKANSGRKKDIA